MRKNITLSLKNMLLSSRIILLSFRNITCYFTERQKIILPSSAIILTCFLNILFANYNITINDNSSIIITSNSTSALDYQTNTNIEFTFNPTISVSVSGDLNIDELVPGSSKDSNIIDVNVSTNNVSGYNLSATVGSSSNNNNNNNPSYNTTNLTHTNNTNTFTSLSTSASCVSLDANCDNEHPNLWGYSYSNDNGTTWINGTGGTGYSGLPLYTSTGTILKQTYNAANDTIKFKIGAKASNTQVTGDYTNIINFIAVANQSPVSFYDAFSAAGKTQYNGYYKMQDMTHDICSAIEAQGNDSIIQLIDVRDNEVYYVNKLDDGNCWMLDNLRLGGDEPIMLTSQNTNIEENTIYQFPHSGWVAENYSVARMNTIYKNSIPTHYGGGSGKIGIYYNFCAASAGTYCYDQNSGIGNAMFDICPANWQMPTGDNFAQLMNAYDSSLPADNSNSISYNLSIVYGGFTTSASTDIQNYNTHGYLWSSTYYNANSMLHPLFSSSHRKFEDYDKRMYGLPVRCLAQ